MLKNLLDGTLVEDLFLDLGPLQRRPLDHLVGADGVGDVFGRLLLRNAPVPSQIFVDEAVGKRDVESKFVIFR